MTKQPLFPPAFAPDLDLDQAGGTNVAVDETFTAAERVQLDSTSRDAITSAVDMVMSGRSSQDEQRDHRPLGLEEEDSSGLHAKWLAGLGCTGLAFDQLDQDRERALPVANGPRLWCPRREIRSTRLESPRGRQ